MEPITLALNSHEADAINRVLDAAVRHAGLQAVLPCAELIHAFRRGELEPGHVATFQQVADWACRGGGLEVAGMALGLVHRIRMAMQPPEPPPDEAADTKIDGEPPTLELVDEAAGGD